MKDKQLGKALHAGFARAAQDAEDLAEARGVEV